MSRILVVDDNETMRSGITLVVERMEHAAIPAASGEEALARFDDGEIDLVISDYRMVEMDGLQLLEAVRQHHPETDVMIITAHGTIELAVDAMKLGAADFITKPFPPDALRLKIDRVLGHRAERRERQRLDEENRYLREEIGGRYGEIVGHSQVIREVLTTVDKVSAADSSVLIYGESGTGKELVARAIHDRSSRAQGAFVKVNCGSLPRGLVESELFGHEKGSFTGAVRQKKGKFELAEGGTVFLDEIGDIPQETQVNLLRVLQEKEFDRVGGERTLVADVRIVAATNRPLRKMVEEGTFREDLYYRLDVIPIQLPPLRERTEDIPLLVDHFLDKKSREMNLPLRRLTEEAMLALQAYPWPGNVRELENIIERTLVMVEVDTISAADLPLAAGDGTSEVQLPADAGSGGGALELNERLERLEKELIKKAMKDAGGVKTHAADILGIKASALYYKLDKYGVE